MFTAAFGMQVQQHLTPFIFKKGLGKLGSNLFGAKSKDAKELVNIARDKGLPLPIDDSNERWYSYY